MLKLRLLCVLLPVLSSGMQDPAGKEVDPLVQLRSDLFTEGVEARKTRERAVGGLLLRKELRAHEILQEAIGRPEDPDLLVPYILDQLEKKWAQQQDPVFGDDSSLRLDLLKSYAGVIVLLLQTENRGERDARQLALEEQVLACLRDSIRPNERMEVFTFLFGKPMTSGNTNVKPAAMFAASGCRDTRLIPLIAEFLDDNEFRVSAQLALQEKIIIPDLFVDRRAFDTWWEHHRFKTNIELVEESARENLSRINRDRSAAFREQQALILKLVVYSAREGDWPQLAKFFASHGGSESRGLFLAKLRDALQSSPELVGDAEERLKLVRSLQAYPGGSENGVQALIVENLAYLVVAGDGEVYEAVLARLQQALFSDSPAESAAAYRGIQRFPSLENRNQVVLAAKAALRRKDKGREGLLAGLRCLSSPDWQPPGANDPDSASWCALLEDVFTDANLGHEAKEVAIKVASKASSKPEMVERVMGLLLARVLEDPNQMARVRGYALDNLPSFVAESGQEERYVEAVRGLLSDGDVQMRRRAAEVLKAPPFASFSEAIRKARIPQISTTVASRLLEESDSEVLIALVDLMVWMNDEPGGDNVVGRLRDVAVQLSQEDAGDEKADLRRELAKGLAILGGTDRSSPAQWVTAGEALLELSQWEDLQLVLRRHQIANLGSTVDAEWTRKACLLVIDAAMARPSNVAWDKIEADEFEFAFNKLKEISDPRDGGYDNQASRLLRLEALASRDLPAEVIKKGVAYLGDPSLTFEPVQLAQVRVLIAKAYIAEALNPAAVEVLLEELAGHPELPELWLSVAGMHVAAKSWAAASQILAARFVDENSPMFREAFLLNMECELGQNPGQSAAVARQLQERSSLYEAPEVPTELLARFRALLARASKS